VALEGGEVPGEAGAVVYPDATGVYLPRVGASFMFGEQGTRPPELNDLPALLTDDTGTLKRRLPGARALTRIRHNLSLDKTGESASFELLLFGLLSARIDLPQGLNVPWGRYDYRDFERRSTGFGFR
jgi:hypothetical protein